jgi:hypothetical protein
MSSSRAGESETIRAPAEGGIAAATCSWETAQTSQVP